MKRSAGERISWQRSLRATGTRNARRPVTASMSRKPYDHQHGTGVRAEEGGANFFERNDAATLYVGNLDGNVDEELLWELFTQCGPVRSVFLPRDRVNGTHQSFAFVEFDCERDADYTLKIMAALNLYGRPLRLSKASGGKGVENDGSAYGGAKHGGRVVGSRGDRSIGAAKLFVGNLAEDVGEGDLNDLFSRFGTVASTKVMRDLDTGQSKRFAFVEMGAFEQADEAIQKLNGQFFREQPLRCSYAIRKESTSHGSTLHGSTAERFLHAHGQGRPAPNSSNLQPPQTFS